MASDLNNKMKKAWLKSMEAIGNTASNIADNTRYKVNEMNLVNRRREILSDFGARAYALWQKGESFPDELAKQLEELSQVDAQLNAIRTERFAGIKTADEQAQKAADDAPQQTDVPTIDEVAQKVDKAAQQVEETAKKSEISKKADAVIDTIGSTLKSVGNALGSAISSLTNNRSAKPADKSEQPAEAVKEVASEKPAAEHAAPTLVVPEDVQTPTAEEIGALKKEAADFEKEAEATVAETDNSEPVTDENPDDFSSEKPDEYKVP